MELRGRVALVTGSSRGIGQAVVSALAARGARVVVNSRTDRTAGEQLADRITASGGEAIYRQADVSIDGEVDGLFSFVEERFGPVDLLVNNAGVTEGQPFEQTSAEHWTRMMNINLLTTVLCSHRAAASMGEAGGCIINTSSIRGFDANGREGVMAYSAAKAAVNNFTRTLAKQLAPRIRVNAVAPGFVATSYMDRVTEEQKEQWLSLIPGRRFITPEEIAGVFVFLAESDFLTGTIINADAGFTLGRG